MNEDNNMMATKQKSTADELGQIVAAKGRSAELDLLPRLEGGHACRHRTEVSTKKGSDKECHVVQRTQIRTRGTSESVAERTASTAARHGSRVDDLLAVFASLDGQSSGSCCLNGHEVAVFLEQDLSQAAGAVLAGLSGALDVAVWLLNGLPPLEVV